MTGFGSAPAGGKLLEIVVSDHALIRARTRRHFAGMPRPELAGRIAHEVQQALAAGRRSDTIPVWACRFTMRELRGGKPKRQRCRPGSFFVWDAHERLGWIVAPSKLGDCDLVVRTSLHRVRGSVEEQVA